MEKEFAGLIHWHRLGLQNGGVAADPTAKVETRSAALTTKVFRPGKVPTAHLKRLYGKSLMGDVVQSAPSEANRKNVEDQKLRFALEPKIDLAQDQAELEQALGAKGDLAFTVALETLPPLDIGGFGDIELEREVVEVEEAEVEKTIIRMADHHRAYAAKEGEDAVAAEGDKLTIDFEGKLNGEAFEGGSGVDMPVVIGSESFIPGFEQQLVGAKVGEHRKLEVKFPDQYMSPKLAGQDASFDVTVKGIAAPGEVTMDDELAKTFGFDTIDALRDAIRERMKDDLSKLSRDKLKRKLLDALDKRYSFELPEGLVSQEFEQIWRQVEAEQKQSGRSFEDEKTTEEEQRAEYRKIAERRVRLGLVLADVGEKAGLKVEEPELVRALTEMVRQYPGHERDVWEFYRKNPQALAQVRAPLLEDKVVDFILDHVKLTSSASPVRVLATDEWPDDDSSISQPIVRQERALSPDEHSTPGYDREDWLKLKMAALAILGMTELDDPQHHLHAIRKSLSSVLEARDV